MKYASTPLIFVAVLSPLLLSRVTVFRSAAPAFGFPVVELSKDSPSRSMVQKRAQDFDENRGEVGGYGKAKHAMIFDVIQRTKKGPGRQ